MYLLAILDSVLKNIGEACAVLVIYAAQVGAQEDGPRWAGLVLRSKAVKRGARLSHAKTI